jgi:uncharacterized damage-inducible protein DinB
MNITKALGMELQQETEQTARLLARVPDDKLTWQPHPKSMTLGRLAGHIAELPMLVPPIMTADELDFEKAKFERFIPKDHEELVRVLKKNVETAVAALQDKDNDFMMQPWRLRAGEKVYFELPRFVSVRTLILNHLIHHRGQLTVYLRLNDVPLPMTYGPSADENP